MRDRLVMGIVKLHRVRHRAVGNGSEQSIGFIPKSENMAFVTSAEVLTPARRFARIARRASQRKAENIGFTCSLVLPTISLGRS